MGEEEVLVLVDYRGHWIPEMSQCKGEITSEYVYMQQTMVVGVGWCINRALGSWPILVSIAGDGFQQTLVGCGGERTSESHRSSP